MTDKVINTMMINFNFFIEEEFGLQNARLDCGTVILQRYDIIFRHPNIFEKKGRVYFSIRCFFSLQILKTQMV